jgi:hypothetical protein
MGRIAAVRARGREVAAAAEGHDAVVVGMDGPFERMVLARYRAAGKFTALLWDALIRHRPKLGQTDVTIDAADFAWLAREWSDLLGRRVLLRVAGALGLDAYAPQLPGHTQVDTIFTAGRFVTQALRSQGVRGTIETTGTPRFAQLLTVEREADTEVQPHTALYLTSSFAAYDASTLDRCQQRDLETLADTLPGFGWELRIRVHPMEDLTRYDRFAEQDGVSVSTRADAPLWSELAGAGVVMTAMSTAGIEALALGRPLLVYLGTFPGGLKETTIGMHPQIPVARTMEDVQNGLETLASLKDPFALSLVVHDFVDPGTSESAERIAGSIVRGIEERAR